MQVHFGPISSGLTRRGSALSMPAFGGRHTAEGDVLQGGRSARHTLRTRSFNKELKGALSGSTYADMDGSNRSSNNVSSNKLQVRCHSHLLLGGQGGHKCWSSSALSCKHAE